ncbi:hypothetical protein N665_0337s0018 [Sinapis alba]|nr:hypothetical protein N665_0337s0018 [Sinapis alba]
MTANLAVKELDRKAYGEGTKQRRQWTVVEHGGRWWSVVDGGNLWSRGARDRDNR